MEYFLLWLLLGQAAYNLATTIKTYELAYKAGVFKTKMKRVSFFLGLAGILLGPIAFLLINFKRDNISE